METKYNKIDLHRILRMLWSRKFVILAVAVICAFAMVLVGILTVQPKYQADILVYVNNSAISFGSTSISFGSGELTAARQLLDTYLVILKSRSTLDSVIEKAGLNYSRSQLQGMISASSVNDTEIFRVVVTSADPVESKIIADTIAEVLPEILTKTVNGSSVEIIDYAAEPQGKASTGTATMAEYGFLGGILLACAFFIVVELFDDKIHDEASLTQMFRGVPILAVIPGADRKKTYEKYASYGYESRNARQ